MKTFIPVEAGEWAKMVQGISLAAELLVEKKQLKDEVAALAAENERRTEQLKLSMSMTDSCIDNINRLTAENERLRKQLAAKEGGADK